eukprot:COSAG03_NODE_3333_length_2075_cov_14.822278_1_plen_132_part_00
MRARACAAVRGVANGLRRRQGINRPVIGHAYGGAAGKHELGQAHGRLRREEATGPIQISPNMTVTLTFTVENNGNVTSDEVAQLYLRTETTSGPHTLRPELKGFARIFAVKPREKRDQILLHTSAHWYHGC